MDKAMLNAVETMLSAADVKDKQQFLDQVIHQAALQSVFDTIPQWVDGHRVYEIEEGWHLFHIQMLDDVVSVCEPAAFEAAIMDRQVSTVLVLQSCMLDWRDMEYWLGKAPFMKTVLFDVTGTQIAQA